MTKEEIYDKEAKLVEELWRPTEDDHRNAILSSMDQYAEQESISFAEWIDGQQLECYLMTDEGEKLWQYMFPKGSRKESFTTAQLFQLYKTQQTKTS